MTLATQNCKSCCSDVEHPDHSAQLNRLNRIIGQLEGVKRMISDRRYCPDIMTQTRAVASAVRALESSILQTHIENCVKDAFSSGQEQADEKIEELLEIFKKYK